MKKEVLHKIFGLLLIIIGAVGTANALFVTFVSNFNIGCICTWCAGLFFLAVGVFYKFFRFKVHWIIKSVLALGVAFVVVLMSFVYIYGKNDNVDYTEDAVIVLGAGIHGESLSITLRNRLDAAVEYYKKNPDAVIVVSGGQGPQEDITEALAMKRYLLEQDIPFEKILEEGRSTSTAENFRFSKEILDSYFYNKEYSVVFVTDDFHIYRAEMTAGWEGVNVTGHCHSVGAFYTFLPNGFRECLAVLHEWVLK